MIEYSPERKKTPIYITLLQIISFIFIAIILFILLNLLANSSSYTIWIVLLIVFVVAYILRKNNTQSLKYTLDEQTLTVSKKLDWRTTQSIEINLSDIIKISRTHAGESKKYYYNKNKVYYLTFKADEQPKTIAFEPNQDLLDSLDINNEY